MAIRFRDKALARAFPRNFRGVVKRGSIGRRVVAVQYALGRLGRLSGLCDGHFGSQTQSAVRRFQQALGLVADGVVGKNTLASLDAAVTAQDFRVPAVRSGDPLAYLSNFQALGLPRVFVEGAEENLTWDHVVIQDAYGRFVADYWPVMKDNHVEGDCKNVALFLMDQFRKQLKEDTMVDLPHPVLGAGRREKQWIIATADKTTGLFSHMNRQWVGRYDYNAMKRVQALDSSHSMIYGVNVHYPEIRTARVGRSVKQLFSWDPSYENRGDTRRPEVPVNMLKPGHMIFIDHTGDDSWDHTVNVVRVDRDARGRTRRLVLAMGSFDDMRDHNSSTLVTYRALNPYSEEVTVDLDEEGLITSSRVSYSSEPSYLVKTRYRAVTTLMERKRGGELMVGRWT